MLYPIFSVIYLSLHRRLLIFDISQFVGFQNFRFLLSDQRFWQALSNTVYFTLSSTALELVFGVGIALLLNRPSRMQGLFRVIILLPWIIPTVVSAKMWEWMYNADSGLFNYILGLKVNWLGDPFLALSAAVVMDVWKTTPFVVILMLAALHGVPREIYQAARLDGAGFWTVFRRITLPLIWPVLMVVMLFRTLDALRVFDAVYVLTGGGPAGSTETLSIYAYRLLFQTLQFGYGSAVSLSVCILASICALGYLSLVRRH